MNCHSVAAVLDLHAEGRLTSRRAAAVEAHLADCASCRKAAAPALASPAKTASSAFKARLAKAMKSAPASAPASIAPTAWPRDLTGVAWAAAALAVVALVVGWSGAPSQQYESGDELAAGRVP